MVKNREITFFVVLVVLGVFLSLLELIAYQDIRFAHMLIFFGVGYMTGLLLRERGEENADNIKKRD